LPFINDTKKNLIGILNYCIQAKVYGIIFFNIGLTLRDGNREYFYQKLDEYFPGLKEKYKNKYGTKYNIISDNNHELTKIFYEMCKKHNIEADYRKIWKYLSDLPENKEQLSLF